MKKRLIFAAAITLFSAGSYAEGTPVSDQAVLTQLQKIEVDLNQQSVTAQATQAQLQKIEQKLSQSATANPFNCTDGDRSFSPGFKLTVNNQKYRCESVDGHGEWKEVLAFQ
jgi:hypothetical protein